MSHSNLGSNKTPYPVPEFYDSDPDDDLYLDRYYEDLRLVVIDP